MRITDLLDKRSISLDAVCASKSDALDQAVALMVKSGKINDEEAYRKQVYLREEESTTGIGEGIAIPHGKTEAVNKPFIAFVQLKDEFFWNEDDAEKIKLIFMIGVPKENKGNIHLKFISQLSKRLLDDTFIDQLIKAENEDEVYEILSGGER